MDIAGVAVPVLAAISTNSLSKIGVAYFAGGLRYALVIAPGVLLSLAVAWLALLFESPRQQNG